MGAVHVLGHTPSPTPGLLVADQGKVRRLDLAGRFDWTLSGERICVGRVEDGVHRPCPTQAPVGPEGTCWPCSGLDDPACVFEPRCAAEPSGCHCATTFAGVEHVVYLAFYGTLPKVGMTQAWRLERRLREQGADAGLLVGRHPDRAAARRMEQAVAFLHRVPEHRSHRETLPQLARPVPWDVLEERAQAWRQRLRLSEDAPLVRIGHPLPQPIGGVPRRVHVREHLEGTWLGVKGPHLVFREVPGPHLLLPNGPLAALPGRELVGRRLVAQAST